jgi:hypothetical protein
MVRTLPHSQREFSPLWNVMEHTHSYRIHIPTDVDISTYDRGKASKTEEREGGFRMTEPEGKKR